MFQFLPRVPILKHTTEKGQLLSITDSAPMHPVGSVYIDVENEKAYVYAYNGTGADHVQYSAELLEPVYSVADPLVHWQTVANADDDGAMVFVCAPAAAHPTLYYGWQQVYGDVDALAGLVNEARTAGEEMTLLNGTYAKATATAVGTESKSFGIVNTTNASAATSGDVFLIGREVTTAT